MDIDEIRDDFPLLKREEKGEVVLHYLHLFFFVPNCLLSGYIDHLLNQPSSKV